MFGISTDYEFEFRLADLERETAMALLKAQAVRLSRAERPARPAFRSRIANALPLKVTVRWEPRQSTVGDRCETVR